VEGPADGYRILGLLGRGLFGEVFRALDPSGRELALKRMPFHPRDRPNVIAQVEVIRSLRHPFLLVTFACHVAADHLVLVTELAEDNLARWLARCRGDGAPGVPAVPLLRYLGEAAEALDYLHAHRYLRHKLNPSNLLRVRGRARVADLFMCLEPDPEYGSHVVGTPVYLAPEEWQGKREAASDQYRLALIYVQMRSGRLPFAGPGMIELFQQQLEGEPDLEGIPEPERPILRRALAREPKQRYASCAELVRQLKGAAGGECVGPIRRAGPDPAWLRWNDGCVTKLARTIDEEGRFEDLPVLADALEDAGCADDALLSHCRSPAHHVRGCWVINLLLGVT
jgi:serine/threonine protein kinase